jgi:rhamnogalacturonan endolyase
MRSLALGFVILLALGVSSCRKQSPAVWLPVGTDSVVVFEDDFSSYPAGALSETYTAAQEYHWLPKKAAWGPWSEATHWHSWDGPSWWISRQGGSQVLHQANQALLEDSNPMVLAGDALWTDYALEVELTPLSAENPVGILYRAEDSGRFFMLSLEEGHRWVWTRRDHEAWVKLKIRETPYKPGQSHTLRIEVNDRNHTFYVDGRQIDITRRDHHFPAGKVGLVANSPCDYRRVRVIMSGQAYEDFLRRRDLREREEREVSAKYPAPKLWKQIDLRGLCVNGRQMRWGDLDGDGRLEFVIASRRAGAADPRAIGGLFAMNLDGELLWQWGRSDTLTDILATDLPFQVCDFNRDGITEVALSHDSKVEFLDGRTGVSLAETPTPVHGPKHPDSFYPEDRTERIPSGVLLFCDLTGAGSPGDYLIKDDYNNLWAFSRDFRQLWTANLNAGHYPYARDIDGDRKDEVLCGYSLFDQDGSRLFDLGFQDHSDAVFLGEAGDKCFEGLHAWFCSGEEGVIVAGPDGTVLSRTVLGHSQRMAIGDFRPGEPGCELAQCTFWGNPGIVSLHAADGRELMEFQPSCLGVTLAAVDWVGDGSSLLLLSGDEKLGGMIDGYGRRVVRFTEPGHPVLCSDALDLCGDSRDEVVLWDRDKMWIYTQENNQPGKVRPVPLYKLPLHSRSNYQMSVALPPGRNNSTR